MKKFYLAHSFILRESVYKWQKMIEKQYNLEFINPFHKNKEERRRVKQLSKIPEERQEGGLKEWSIKDCTNIMREDLNLIRSSDGVVALFDKPTVGTCQEIFAAAYVFNKPVYIITNKYMYHPWLRVLANMNNGKIFRNMYEFRIWLDKEGFLK